MLTAGYIPSRGELSAPGCRWEVWRESLCACMSARDHGLDAAAAAAARFPPMLCTLETRTGVGTTGTLG